MVRFTAECRGASLRFRALLFRILLFLEIEAFTFGDGQIILTAQFHVDTHRDSAPVCSSSRGAVRFHAV